MYSVVLMAAITAGTEVPDFGGRRGGCHGCYGGSSCCGCYGGGYGGGYARGCYGGYGCYGGCYGGGCYGGGCYGGGYGGYRGGYGGYGGGYGGALGVYGSTGSYYPSGLYALQGTYTPGTAVVTGTAPATLVVNLPANASLVVDGTPTQATSARRVFNTPPLEEGRTYYYTLRAQVMRDGQPVETTRNVTVRAGQETTVSFELPAATVASRE